MVTVFPKSQNAANPVTIQPSVGLYPDLGQIYTVLDYPDLVWKDCGQVPATRVTKASHDCAKKVINLAMEVADTVSYPAYSASPINSSSHHSSSLFSSFFRWPSIVYAPSTTNILSTTNNYSTNNDRHDRNNRDNDVTNRVIILIIGLFAAVVGAIKLGKTLAEKDNLEAKNDNFEDAVQQWNNNPSYNPHLGNVIRLTRWIVDQNKKKPHDSIYKVALPILVGGGSMVTGAVAGGSLGAVLMPVGALLAVGGGVYGIYKYVRNANTHQSKLAVDQIHQEINYVRELAEYKANEGQV